MGVLGQNVLVHEESAQAALARAKGYPYPRPSTSYVFVAGDVLTFDNSLWRGPAGLRSIAGRSEQLQQDISLEELAHHHGVCWADACPGQREGQGQGEGEHEDDGADDSSGSWTAVLAIGSNAAPEQLRRKFPNSSFPGGVVVPVIQAVLHDFDVVYSPYISSYGSCTATLEHSPGTAVLLAVTYLTPPLLRRMHETEGGYDLCRLNGVCLLEAPLLLPPGDHHYGPASPGGADGDRDGGRTFCLAPQGPADVGARSGGTAARLLHSSSALAYNHTSGTLVLPLVGRPASPVAIADIPAMHRRFPAATQTRMLAALKQALPEYTPSRRSEAAAAALQPVELRGSAVHAVQINAPGGGSKAAATAASGMGDVVADAEAARAAGSGDSSALDEWILECIGEHHVRWQYVRRLEVHAQPFQYANNELVERL